MFGTNLAQQNQVAISHEVKIPAGSVTLNGELNLPKMASGIVLFAHGSGSSRHSPRNQYVASTILEAGVGTLLFDLLTKEEETTDRFTAHIRFDIDLLAQRLIHTTNWIKSEPETEKLRVGYFGASTGGGAALMAAAKLGMEIGAVVSRGGRPDLAGDFLEHVHAPTLLLVGSYDDMVIALNEAALAQLRCEKEMILIPGATHLFEEPGTLEEVARLAADWFKKHL